METASFNVPSITCSLCSSNIQKELGGTKGVLNVNIDIKSQSVKVDYDPSVVRPEEIQSRISSMGYEVVQ